MHKSLATCNSSKHMYVCPCTFPSYMYTYKCTSNCAKQMFAVFGTFMTVYEAVSLILVKWVFATSVLCTLLSFVLCEVVGGNSAPYVCRDWNSLCICRNHY